MKKYVLSEISHIKSDNKPLVICEDFEALKKEMKKILFERTDDFIDTVESLDSYQFCFSFSINIAEEK